MPSASNEQRARWYEPNGDIGEHRPQQYLKDRGYKLIRGWVWVIPENHTPTETELDAIDYLINEWDFGGAIKKEHLNLKDASNWIYGR